MLLRHCK